MNFASKYVFACETPEYEYVSDEEYDHGMDVSCSDSSGSSDEDEPAVGTKSVPERAAPDLCEPVIPSAPIYGACTPPGTAGGSGAPPPPPPPRQGSLEFSGIGPLPPARGKKGKKMFHWKSAPCAPPPPQASRSRAGARKFRRADTNVVSVKLNELVAPSNMHAGDPVYCTQCRAILSKISKLETDDTEKVWVCNFCAEQNQVDVEDEEIPQSDDVTFLVEPAPATTATGPSGLDESLVIFCVDISGSMCVTTEVPGKLKLRGTGGLKRLQSLNDTREDQFLPRQRRDVTYVSRLQAVQAAVDHQLEEMQKDHPSRRVALITFDNEVTVIGDGTGEATSVAGDKLTNVESLTKLGQELGTPRAIKETRRTLGDKLFSLEEGGATALGPSLVIAVAMAADHPGSKVIICTDGMANVGMGKLDEAQVELMEDDTESFYDTIGSTAMEKGVAISVVTIKGTDCKLVELGKLADKTGGQVNIVDPLKLTQEFSTILADRIVATNVVATFILHKQLYFHHENIETQESRVVRDVGNVTMNTEITFEYGVKPDSVQKNQTQEETQQGAGAASTGGAGTSSGTGSQPSMPEELPFQLQIRYTDTEGMKALRVLTQIRPITRNRDLAEKSVDLNVLGTHAAQKTANLALAGEYTMSRGAALMNQRLAWRSAHQAEAPSNKAWYRKIFSKIQAVDHHVTKAQQSEISRRGRTYSDSEGEDDLDVIEAEEKSKKKKKKKKTRARASEVADEFAECVYEQSRITSNKLN